MKIFGVKKVVEIDYEQTVVGDTGYTLNCYLDVVHKVTKSAYVTVFGWKFHCTKRIVLVKNYRFDRFTVGDLTYDQHGVMPLNLL